MSVIDKVQFRHSAISTQKKSTECQPGWKHKNDEIALCRNCLCRSDWHPMLYYTVDKFTDNT